jgi:tetratricopeptide (TPR) repeat protein
MEMYPHPPAVVTLSNHRMGTQTPEADSPLSSAPSSPRAKGRMLQACASLEDMDPIITSREIPSATMIPHSTTTACTASDVPFDESGLPEDEKKVDEGDELMGIQPSRRTLYQSSYLPIEDEDNSQPPSLALRSTSTTATAMKEKNNKNKDMTSMERPTMIRRRSKTTGDLKPQELVSTTTTTRPLTPELKRSGQTNTNTNEETHLNFAALKKDILSMPQNNFQDLLPDTTANYTGVMAPIQEPSRYPPKLVLKQTTLWDSINDMDMDNSDPLLTKRQPPSMQQDFNPVVSPSPDQQAVAYPSYSASSYEADRTTASSPVAVKPTADTTTTAATTTTTTAPTVMVSPNGYVLSMHNQVLNEFNEAKLQEQLQEEIVFVQDNRKSPFTEGSMATTHVTNTNNVLGSPRNSLDDETTKTSLTFHYTQGDEHGDEDAVSRRMTTTMEKPQAAVLRSQSEPPAMGQDPFNSQVEDVLQEFTSTLSDVVDLATLGASAMGEYVFCGPTTTTMDDSEPPFAPAWTNKPPSGGGGGSSSSPLVRSVSDVPRSLRSATTGQSNNNHNDWSKYLQTRGVVVASSKTTGVGVSSQIGSTWLTTDKKTEYREMTPKKDFQSSEKSAAWLQEEFKRRSFMKLEINDAILARNGDDDDDDDEGVSGVKEGSPAATDAPNDSFTVALSKALKALPPRTTSESVDYDVKGENSQSTEDDEVAAITQEEGTNTHVDHPPKEEQDFELHYKSNHSGGHDLLGKPHPRRLEFDGSAETKQSSELAKQRSGHTRSTHGSDEGDISVHSSAANSRHVPLEAGRHNPVARVTEVLASPSVFETNNNGQSLASELREEMRRFASDTRAALRDKAPHDKPSGKDDEPLLNSPFRSLAIATSMGGPDELQTIEVNASFKSALRSPSENPSLSANSSSSKALPTCSSEGAASDGTDVIDIRTATPVMVQSMDSVFGIAKGDIALSLLNENTGRIETSEKATWANRVHGAIWRCRRMRRSTGAFPKLQSELPPGSAPRGRSSLPVDMDKARVTGGVRSVQSTQDAALSHLKHDEIDEALELFEDIIFAYYAYFERSLQAREQNPGSQGASTDFRPYIGMALHNLGILNLLNGEYQEALSFFGRAIENRRSCLGQGHPDHVASLVKLAICHYALNEFGEAHARLEEALVFARTNCASLEDGLQMAEILNNLGCLAYMCGQPVAATSFYRESLDVQFGALSASLYGSTAFVGQSISLNISITRANIGFVKLVTKDLPVAVTALENALMVSSTSRLFYVESCFSYKISVTP